MFLALKQWLFSMNNLTPFFLRFDSGEILQKLRYKNIAIIFLCFLVPGEQFVSLNFKREKQLIKLMRINNNNKKSTSKDFWSVGKKLIFVLMRK